MTKPTDDLISEVYNDVPKPPGDMEWAHSCPPRIRTLFRMVDRMIQHRLKEHTNSKGGPSG